MLHVHALLTRQETHPPANLDIHTTHEKVSQRRRATVRRRYQGAAAGTMQDGGQSSRLLRGFM